MSGGSQHNPNGRQAQLGAAGWSPLQLQMANLLARAPQAHMASDRGVTWHTPTPPAHLYHVPAPSSPDPLQAMKAAAAGSVYRHSATPPEIYRHTPTPPDKHMMRHTPSPGDLKAASAALPPGDLFSHLGPGREKHRQEDVMAYARGGSTLDLSLGGRGSNGASGSPAPPAHSTSPALSVRDAPTINSLIARAQPRPAHTRVDTILERLAPSPVSPHSVIVHPRVAPTPSPPSSNEDSADSCGAPPGSKRKRKPEKTLRLPTIPPPLPIPEPLIQPKLEIVPKIEPDTTTHIEEKTDVPDSPMREEESRVLPAPEVENTAKPIENGETVHINGPEKPPSPKTPEPHTRRKTRTGSETLDDIAAVVAGKVDTPVIPEILSSENDAPVTIDNLKNVLSSPNASRIEAEVKKSPAKEKKAKKSPIKDDNSKNTSKSDIIENQPENPIAETPIPPRRKSSRISHSETTNVPIESPSEAKPAETDPKNTESTTSSFVEVETELEKMFAGIEEPKTDKSESRGKNEAIETLPTPPKAKKRRKSTPAKGEKKVSRRSSRASTGDETNKKKPQEPKNKNTENVKKGTKKGAKPKAKEQSAKDAYDSGSNASSGKSRGPFIQIRGPRDSPLSVSVINASTGEEEGETSTGRVRKGEEFRNGLRARGLHASTLGLRYDATTPDATWLCAFCNRGPHKEGLGDLFGPYTLNTDCEEYRTLDEATRRRYETAPNASEVWFHEECAVWAPGLVAVGARIFGLSEAVWATRGAKCTTCGKAGAPVACSTRACPARTHIPCANKWTLLNEEFRAICPRHA